MLAALLCAILAAADPSKPDARPAPAALVTAPPLTAARALEVAGQLTVARHALREARRAAAELKDLPLRSAVEAQLAAPWLPESAWAYAHLGEAEAKLRAAGLLGDGVQLAALLPKPGTGAFASAPGGPCPSGHHAYPGGLAVHSWANLLHARGLAAAYQDAYGVKLDDDLLVAGALWHDTLKAATLPWDAEGNCPAAEPQLAGTALHHPLGIAAAILRRLPVPLVWVIASAHAPITADKLGAVCGWIRAAGVIAKGDEKALPCPSLGLDAKPVPAEAFINHFADADFLFTGAVSAWYAAQTKTGWARYQGLAQDGSDVAAWVKAQAR